MDYYTRKEKAINYIRHLYKEGKTEKQIVCRIENMFQLGEKFVLGYLEKHKENLNEEIKKEMDSIENTN